MARCRFVRPDAKRIEISDGDWLLVKRRLTRGERETYFARCYVSDVDGARPDLTQLAGMALVTAYLLDWSLLGLDDKPVVIRGKPMQEVEAALNALDPDDFKEIRSAIEAHERAMQAERDEQKKILSGETAGAETLPSPGELVGVSNG